MTRKRKTKKRKQRRLTNLNDARNIKIGEDDREAELPAGTTMAQIVESVSKMNKKERAKVLERNEQPEQTRKTNKDPPRNQVGGSSGSGIPRDPVTGRAL